MDGIFTTKLSADVHTKLFFLLAAFHVLHNLLWICGRLGRKGREKTQQDIRTVPAQLDRKGRQRPHSGKKIQINPTRHFRKHRGLFLPTCSPPSRPVKYSDLEVATTHRVTLAWLGLRDNLRKETLQQEESSLDLQQNLPTTGAWTCRNSFQPRV